MLSSFTFLRKLSFPCKRSHQYVSLKSTQEQYWSAGNAFLIEIISAQMRSITRAEALSTAFFIRVSQSDRKSLSEQILDRKWSIILATCLNDPSKISLHKLAVSLIWRDLSSEDNSLRSDQYQAFHSTLNELSARTCLVATRQACLSRFQFLRFFSAHNEYYIKDEHVS